MRWWSVLLLFLIAGPTIALAVMAREHFRDGKPLAGYCLSVLCALWAACLVGAALGMTTETVARALV